MHILIGVAVLAGLIGFAFGETAARAFVGVLLALAALAVLGLVGIGIVGFSRQNVAEACMPADAHWQYPVKRCTE